MDIPILGGLLRKIGKLGDRAIGNMSTRGGLLDPGQDENLRRAMRSQALIGFGTSMLDSAGGGQNFAQSLAAGVQGGQSAGTEAFTGAQEVEKMKRARAMQSLMQEKYAANPNAPIHEQVNQLYSMFIDANRNGDYEMAKNIATVLNSLGSGMLGRPPGKPTFIRGAIDPTTGRPGVAVVDPSNPAAEPDFISGVEMPEMTPYQADAVKQKGIDNVAGLHRDYLARRKEVLPGELGTAIRTGLKVLPDAMRGDGLAQLTAVFAYLRLLDPKSVVREGEVENVVKRTAALPDWLWKELMRATGRTEAVDAPEGTEVNLGKRPPKGAAPLLAAASMASMARLFSGQVDVINQTADTLREEMYGVAEDVLGLSPEETRKKIRFRTGFEDIAKSWSSVNKLVQDAEKVPSVPPATQGAGQMKPPAAMTREDLEREWQKKRGPNP